MAKKILTKIKLQITGQQATPAPPTGPALGQYGLNISEFCNRFNEATKDRAGEIVPVEITVYEDRTYNFITKTTPTSELLKKAANLKKGSSKPLLEKNGTVTDEQIKEIAKIKMPDLNTENIDSAIKSIKGTAKQMGIEIK